LAFDQGREVAVVRAGEQVAFPVAGHRAVGDLGRARPDRHRVHDLPAVLPGACRRPRPPQGPLRPQVSQQLLLEHAARLDEQAPVDGLVRHLHPLVLRERVAEPASDLFRRPVLLELLGDQGPQSGDRGELTPLRAPGQLPSGGIGGRRTVAGAAAVPSELAAHRGRGTPEPPGDLVRALPARHAARDLLALPQGQHPRTAPAGDRGEATCPGQDALHHRAPAIEGAGDRVQSFALAPSSP
jgi:hypothetical protein